MGTNTTLTSFVILATLSSSVISLPYDSSSLIPETISQYTCQNSIADWKDNAFNSSSGYHLQEEYPIKIKTIIDFSRKIVENSIDIENEYVDIVNENFWDLI